MGWLINKQGLGLTRKAVSVFEAALLFYKEEKFIFAAVFDFTEKTGLLSSAGRAAHS